MLKSRKLPQMMPKAMVGSEKKTVISPMRIGSKMLEFAVVQSCFVSVAANS